MSRPQDLYSRYWAELCRVLRRRFGDGPPDPEEAAQVAYMRLHEVEGTRVIENPRGFLHHCAKHYILNHRRHQAVQGRYATEFAALNDGATPDELSAERVLEVKARLAVVAQAIDGLEEKRRRILLMRQIDELTFAEIAARMNLSYTRVVQLFTDAIVQCSKAARAAETPGETDTAKEKQA
jgi:RNA polymerase sigma-70 factor (ECF subfamily)